VIRAPCGQGIDRGRDGCTRCAYFGRPLLALAHEHEGGKTQNDEKRLTTTGAS
jgi:hypothetical protein